MMRLPAFLVLLLAVVLPATAQDVAERQVVDASEPQNLSVTIYRDPNRRLGQEMQQNWPEGFAMISETRTVTLPAGRSTIRFDGVAEGMIGVSAIVTGLPGGTIEKNRNAELLSPAALVNGALGNQVTVTRSNPATGEAIAEDAIVRTRADGGLVLETSQGFEAVRCAGIPERLTFDRVPDGLSAKPVFSIDTQSQQGGTYEVTLTYLAWGFDWQANYVATLQDKAVERDGSFRLNMLSWLTVLNNNGQSFDDAELLVIAGTLNVVSDFDQLSEEPVAEPLRLTCYPRGSTASGSSVPSYGRDEELDDGLITVTARRKEGAVVAPAPMAMSVMSADEVMEAVEEQLGDLKLYRVPERVTVSAKGLKQVAFLNRQDVEARLLYTGNCDPYSEFATGRGDERYRQADILLATENDEEKGLGVALPQGGMAVFEPSSFGPQLVASSDLRDYAVGQDVELSVGTSNQVFTQCARVGTIGVDDGQRRWVQMRSEVTNANPHPIRIRMVLGESGGWDVRWPRARTQTKDGEIVVEFEVPANSDRNLEWRIRRSS